MDTTLTYSLLVGIALVLLFVIARIAVRWIIRLAIIVVILIALGAAAWYWLNRPPSQPESKPRSTPTREGQH